MTGPRAARRTRATERGVTLIELLITIGVLAVGFVAVLTAFAQTELAVGTTNANAILASRASQVASYIQASGNFTYVQCTGALGQSPGGVKSYLAQLFDNTSKVRISGAWTTRDRIVSVAQATSGSHTVSGQQVPITPRSDCALSGTGSTADFGVQQIVFQVVSPGGQVLTRTVYKRWN